MIINSKRYSDMYNGFRDWRTSKLKEYKKDNSNRRRCYICGAFLREGNKDGYCSCHKGHIDDISQVFVELAESYPEHIDTIADLMRDNIQND